MSHWKAYNDAASQQVFQAFKERLEPLMETLAPDWMLHHIEMRRRGEFEPQGEQVEIRLVIKPIGSARWTEEPDPLPINQRALK